MEEKKEKIMDDIMPTKDLTENDTAIGEYNSSALPLLNAESKVVSVNAVRKSEADYSETEQADDAWLKNDDELYDYNANNASESDSNSGIISGSSQSESGSVTDDAEELFIETDFEISAQPEKPVENPKPVAEKPVAEKKEPVVEKPIAEKPIVEKPVVEKKEEPVKPVKAEEKKPIIEKKVKQEVPVEAVEEDFHEEDDILKFIPPKSAPAQPAKQAPAPTPKPQRSLNDLFNEHREDHSISSQYQRAKVGDLTKAISINDKFIYIKELFHNRGEDFSASIRQLNECQNMEEAFDCLEELKQKYFWDSKSDAYLSFCDLLRRKYS